MTITIEEAKAFILDCEKARENWLKVANQSWAEIKKRQSNGKLWSISPNSVRKRARYSAWYSIFKIRQPLLLSRVGIPIGRDTTMDGSDSIGASAAFFLERLAKSLSKDFDFFDVVSCVRDDALAVNFANLRAYYERDEVKQQVKEYITPQKNSETSDYEFVKQDGSLVTSDDIEQDDQGYFIEHDEVVDVENEKVCLEFILYKDWYIDPDIRRWNRCRRLAIACYYSRREFSEIFGKAALATLPNDDETSPGASEAAPKRQTIKVFEYWDDYEQPGLPQYFVDGGTDFITPKDSYSPDSEEYAELKDSRNGLYDLKGFFPCPKPLMWNQPTDEFYPVPEYYQLFEVIEDVHNVFSQMFTITKALRPRLLFDNSIEGLQAAINEAATADAFGIDNLAQSLVSSGGSLEAAVQYVPVGDLITALQTLSQVLQDRIQTIFQLSGTTDLLQGLSQDNSGKTLGEKQIEEKYAVNQIAEAQRKMAEFVRDCYQILCEMALKNFKDASLAEHTMPQTAPPEHQKNYEAAMGMLKENEKRFRVELETDSTVAINEQYDKQMRIELTNTLTSAIEKVANIANQTPELVSIELHALKFLIQAFPQSKMFQDEITQAIDTVMQDLQNKPQPFDKDAAQNQVAQQQVKINQFQIEQDAQIEAARVQSNERIEMAKLQQRAAIDNIQVQLDQFKLMLTQQKDSGELNLRFQELQASIAETQEKLANDRESILVELRKVTSGVEIEQFKAQMQQQINPYQLQLDSQEQLLEQMRIELEGQTLAVTDKHVMLEKGLEQVRLQIEAAQVAHDASKPPEIPPITINMPQPASTKKSIKIKRDELGNIQSLDSQDIQEAAE